MKVIDKGNGEPEIVVIGSIHGDEPAGKNAIESLIKSNQFEKPVRFIVANEKALKQDKRYIDSDLNRSFPGDPESEKYEERLASRIMEKIEGKTVLDLHTTHSYPEPFANIKSIEDVEYVKECNVDTAVYFPEESGALTGQAEGIVIETGYQKSEEAVKNAEEVTKNFLASRGVIDEEYSTSDPEVFRYYETVEGDYEFLANNFQRVEAGTVYARNESEELVAEEAFYPVLMSTNGYDGQLGFKAEKLDF